MNIKKFIISILLLGTSFVYSQDLCKEVIGYFPNWQWYDRGKLVNPQTIQYHKYSIINYAFFSPQADGHIVPTDTWADDNLLLGTPIWYPEETNDFTSSVIYLAHQANVKVLPSIGGWTLSNNFPSIAADPTKRATFVADCIQLINDHQFDGVDIDWEYPGFAEHNGTSADKVNFTILMQDIRDALDLLETTTGKTYLLSACFSVDPPKMENIEYGNLVNILDMFNMMSYDLSGTFDAIASHNSPLYAPAQGSTEWNLDATFHRLTDVYNVPADKINLGIAFYGRSMTVCDGLFSSHSGMANTSTFSVDEGTPLYYNILANIDLFTENWDDVAKVPYLTDGPDQTYVTYDNELSVYLKGKYIVENEARGAIIWELTGDYIETSPGSGIIESTPLVDALNSGLCTSTNTSPIKVSSSFDIYPNPASDYIYVKSNFNSTNYLSIYNTNGQVVLQQTFEGNINIDLSHLNKGIYLIKNINNEQIISQKFIIEK